MCHFQGFSFRRKGIEMATKILGKCKNIKNGHQISSMHKYCICSLFSNIPMETVQDSVKESFKYSNLVATSLKRYCV
jgi:hypothetical protein